MNNPGCFGFRRSLICGAFVVSLALTSWGQAFQITRIPSLGSWPTFPMAINNKGEVVGSSVTSEHQSRAFLWTRATGTQDLGTISGASSARAINNESQVVGVFGEPGKEQLFLWTRESGMHDPHIAAIPADINDLSQIVGYYNNAQPHAFLWSQSTGLQDLGTLGGCCSRATGINNSGQVVGWSFPPTGSPAHPFVWTAQGGMHDLGFPGQASAINNSGQAVGFYSDGKQSRAFLWSEASGLQDLGSLDGTTSFALDINDNGCVIGISGTNSHAFLWTKDGGMQDVSAMLAGKVLSLIVVPDTASINNAGQIVSAGEGLAGRQAPLVITPIINVTLTSSHNPSYVGQPFTLTATAKSVIGPPPDRENIDFFSGTTLLATVPTHAGVAKFKSTGSKTAKVGFRANYPGDLNYFPSKPSSLTQVVNRWPTSIDLVSNSATSNFGEAVTLTAQVNASGTDALRGSVVFKSGATSLGSRALTATGITSLTTTKLQLGTNAATATYNGDTSNNKSTSTILALKVNQAVTEMTMTSSPNPSLLGRLVKFTALLTSNGGLPVGDTVTFTSGSTTLGTAAIGAGGVAVLSTTTLSTGSHTVTATYAGDADYMPAQASVMQTVK
jgi:probable HAF family extracellular repeat protein